MSSCGRIKERRVHCACAFDRKYAFNVLGVYNLPFGKDGDNFYDRLTHNWSVSRIFTLLYCG